MDKVSVLIPVFNRELFIQDSLDSILTQTYKDLEIIIYDDGSTDNTVKIIEQNMKKDPRIKLIKGLINKGVGHARNELLKACITKYACWHDSDDQSQPKRIHSQYNQIKDTNKLVFCKWLWLHHSKGRWIPSSRNTNSKAFATIMFPVDKTITFKKQLKIGGEDWDWIKRMKLKYLSESTVNDILYCVKFHDDRIGSWKRKMRKKIPKEILGKLSYKDLIDYYKENYEK